MRGCTDSVTTYGYIVDANVISFCVLLALNTVISCYSM